MMASEPQQQQNVPDAPTAAPDSGANSSTPSLKDLKNEVAPGKTTTPENNGDNTPAAAGDVPPAAVTPPAAPPASSEAVQQGPPEIPAAGQAVYRLPTVNVNFVPVPVTVRDSKHNLVAGLTWRDFQVFENGTQQRISFFTTDPLPLSVAFVIDQSVPADTMKKVNESLAAIAGAFSPSDEIALFTYNKFVEEPTTFTAAQGARLPAVISRIKAPGRDMGAGYEGGPLANGPIVNGQTIDPNLNTQRGNSSTILVAPKEIHPLNDAILAAAKELAAQPKGRRRIIYVVSDGKEAGSKASQREVVQYLLTNNITVYGTLVGDSATWGLGYLDKIKLPLMPSNNILPRYTIVTGGALEAEFSTTGIERSFGEITASVRTQYLIGYYSHEPIYDGKRRTIEVRTPNRPGLDITAKSAYYPAAVAR